MEQTVQTNQQKAIKITKIVLTVIFYVFIALLLLFSIITLSTKTKRDLPNIFGTGILPVATDSMDGNEPDSFKQGTLIFARVLSEEEKLELKDGQIIVFYDRVLEALNTHRVHGDANRNGDGVIVSYNTRRDKDNGVDDNPVLLIDVVALHTGSKIGGVGNVIAFMQTQLGFALVVILPVIIMLAWNGYILMNSVFAIKKEKLQTETNAEKERLQAENELEKERMRAELLEQLRKEQEEKSDK